MNPRRTITKIVGLTQTAIGVTAMIFAFIAFNNILGIQTILGVSEEGIGLYMWVFIIFGLLSVISGLLLFYEK